jgi:hypothetical protein
MAGQTHRVYASQQGARMTEIDWRLVILALGVAGVLIWTFYDAIR